MNPDTEYLLSTFDTNLTKLNLNELNIKGILDLSKFTRLEELECQQNEITQIINLPETLKELNCESNNIDSFQNLPENLQVLCCRGNRLKSLDNLPASLILLDCSFNKNIKSLDYLPANLFRLECDYCNLQNIYCLPVNLKQLNCQSNKNLVLTGIPPKLEALLCTQIPIDAPENCDITLFWYRNKPINEKELKDKYKNLTIKIIF